MAKRRPDPRLQPSLFSEPEPEPIAAPAPAVDTKAQYLADLREQVIRDAMTLRMDPVFWAPSREFYEGRMVSYREEIARVEAI